MLKKIFLLPINFLNMKTIIDILILKISTFEFNFKNKIKNILIFEIVIHGILIEILNR